MILTAAGDLAVRAAAFLGEAQWTLALGSGAALAAREHGRARSRQALNRALHELRRPLQAMLLGAAPAASGGDGGGSAPIGAGPGQLDLALAALSDLDAELNAPPRSRQGRTGSDPPPIEGCGAALAAAARRWTDPARTRGRSLAASCEPSAQTDLPVASPPVETARALDNLIANALDHGRGDLRIGLQASRGAARFTVCDGSDPPRDPVDGGDRSSKAPSTLVGDGSVFRADAAKAGPGPRQDDPRRGHGLAIAAGIARRAGGELRLGVGQAGSRAVLELPLAGGAPP